jgi:hypothetical protein
MSKLIVKVSDFTTSNLSVGQVKALESGGKMASLGYNNGGSSGPLMTQIGPLSLPYGMNVFDKAGPIKYSMDLSLRGYEDDSNVQAIYQTFSALDEWMIDQGVANSKSWFKAQLTRDVVKAFYTPMVKVPKDADGNPKPYPPTIKVNLRKDKNNADSWEVKVYERVDGDVRKVDDVPLEDLLIKGAQITTLIQCTSVWFAGSKYGLSWKANQIRMEKVPDSIRGYAFIDDAPSTAGASSRPSISRPSAATSSAPAPVAQNKFSSLDDAEDDDAFDAPAPTGPSHPVTAVAKKQTQSVLTAMMPSAPSHPVSADIDDEDAEDAEPIPVPVKKTTTTAKKVVKTVKKN